MKTSLTVVALVSALVLAAPATAATFGTLTGEAPLVVAHRGASGYLPEHTLGGYELSIRLGADYIEPDLQLTADGALVAMHDTTMIRTTNVQDVFPGRDSYRVSDFTLAEIRQLTVQPFGPQAGPEYPGFTPSMANPYQVPTFDEVLDFLTAHNAATGDSIGIYPEAKSPTSETMNRQIVEKLSAAGFSTRDDRAIIQSFDFDALRMIGEIQAETGASQFRAALGGASLIGGEYAVGGTLLTEIATFADGLGVSMGGSSAAVSLTQGFVDAAHALGLAVHGYTLRPLTQAESDAQIAALLNLGYDGFFTDYTDRSRTSLNALAPAPVPLPAGGLLIATALGALAVMRRRQAV
ncbi:MAG: glycerophosphodiester phosphodiesterase family protein [Paracoccus sp. (in: a-proteobacteria)]|uniref:glycerophosphodiester phosphodiesterase family protein n=1 Tax=Paracoccus sp. TaxID=267 RepID=UPI0026E076FE|nr:glycerophosphodiester phosphodiesterase family protein [Paracoccus sp. (in: a-proteobacteria)]MDO5612024.1 glycerophosphodiester phosphodiesterase family protein [Paracoccus sp. (in: a-proteobacteria)]